MGFVRYRAALLLIVALMVLGTLSPAEAQVVRQPFTLQPTGKATVTFEAFCTDFGKFFPQQIQAPNGQLAPDPIRSALAYIREEGLAADPATALDANYGIWQLDGARGAQGQGGQIAQDVVAAGANPPQDPQGVSLLEAVRDGTVKLTLVSWEAIGPKVQILSATDNFYGKGVLEAENISDEALDLYMPAGTLFPGVDATTQVMGGYATDVVVNNPQLPSTSGGVRDLLGLVLLSLILATAGAALRTGRTR